eukprot:scaffold95325_cov32-Tisochrysis_lutea.AAC.2
MIDCTAACRCAILPRSEPSLSAGGSAFHLSLRKVSRRAAFGRRDVSTTRCTLVQYVGELCRFLLQAPPSEFDRSHCVRLAFGNGMRPDVWPRFVERFKVPRIGELYASTEGNANLANTENKPGAVGFISPLLAPLYPVKLVRLADDDGTAGGELMRRPDGLCVECEPGEAGELLGKATPTDWRRPGD